MDSRQLAWLIRRHGIEMTHLSGGSHIGAIMSVADIIAVEEHNIIGGFGSAIAEVMAEIKGNKSYLIRIGLNDVYGIRVGNQKYLRSVYGISADTIVSRIEEALDEA